MDCIADLVPKCSYFVCEACIGKGGEILDSNQFSEYGWVCDAKLQRCCLTEMH